MLSVLLVSLVLRSKTNSDSQYIYNTILSDNITGQIDNLIVGSNYPAINSSDVKNLTFPIPPLPEQKKIASILTSVDDVIEKTEAQISKLQDLKKGMMTELLTKGIGHTEFKDSPVGKIPVSWEVKSANDICSKITKGTTPPKVNGGYSSDVPFLRVNNLFFDNKVHFEKGLLFISKEIHEGFLARSIVYPNDILMNIVGPPLGKISLVPDNYSEYNINQAIIIYRLSDYKVNLKFLLHFLTSSIAQDWFEIRAKKTSGQKNLTIELCKELPIPVPRIEEQDKIAGAIDAVDLKIVTKQNKLTHTKSLKKALMNDLLTGKKRVITTN